MNLKYRVIHLEKEVADLKRQLEGQPNNLGREFLVELFKTKLNQIMQTAELKVLFSLGICTIEDQMRLGLIISQEPLRNAEEGQLQDQLTKNVFVNKD